MVMKCPTYIFSFQDRVAMVLISCIKVRINLPVGRIQQWTCGVTICTLFMEVLPQLPFLTYF